MMAKLGRILVWGFAIGGICFAAGFFGPIILAPDANQGPLLGIFITGPLGTLAGLAFGTAREFLGHTAGPRELLARTGLGRIDRHQVLRPLAAVGGLILLIRGVSGLQRGEGRGAAASVVVAGALLWYAAAGRVPNWFFR